MHRTTAIRHAIHHLLATADAEGAHVTRAGDRVFASRTAPLSPPLMPAILVYAQADRADGDRERNQPDGPMRRVLTVVIKAAVAGQNADDEVDALCGEIEAALGVQMNLGGLCESIRWQATTLESVGEGAQLFMAGLMAFAVTYWTAAEHPAPDVPTTVYAGTAPLIGPGNETHYRDITGTNGTGANGTGANVAQV
jgi:hypothetical protein